MQSAHGDQMHIPTTMHKRVAKFPPSFNWFPEMITGSTVTSLLQEHVHEAAIEDILVRQDMYSATICSFMNQKSTNYYEQVGKMVSFTKQVITTSTFIRALLVRRWHSIKVGCLDTMQQT